MRILETDSLCKSYFNKVALAEINIKLEQGRIVGLLGPNGSGKTTLLKLIAGLIRPTSGNISICNEKVGYKSKSLAAYLPNGDFLYPWMKISDAAALYSTFYKDFNKKKCDELIKFMQLDINSKFCELSGGMKEKLALTLTLSRDAKLLILDEPLNGVDPIAREQILGAILKGFSFDSSMIITTHLVNEVERILDEVIFLRNGKMELWGETDEIRSDRKMTLDEVYREVFAP